MKFKYLILFFFITTIACKKVKSTALLPKDHEREERNTNPDKNAIWTPEQALRHQKILQKLSLNARKYHFKRNTPVSYADGNLDGTWKTRGPKNMPGAFKFAEMLEGTDTIYGITHNHYPGEYNSKSYIFRGTVYNPKLGKGGDDFVSLTAFWPNRYQNLFVFKKGNTTRIVAHIENGPLYYSDDQGVSWSLANGLPDANTSSIINRQDNHTIYVTDKQKIYKSTDYGENFDLIKDFGSKKSSFLYTPRYAIQPSAAKVYLARSGEFYELNAEKTDFSLLGTYTASHGENQFSVGGDNRVFYITEGKDYWTSVDGGATWVSKYPNGNWYGDRTGKMSPGKFLAVHPENPNISIAGYAIPVISLDKLETTLSTTSGWGRYQNGNNLSASDYYNRIRFNYHPDFQSCHFFYNSSGDLFSARCSDGGIFISYKEWTNFPPEGTAFDNTGYENAHFINLNVLNTINPLVYRTNMFTGANDPTNHIYYGTQDQGSASIIAATNEDLLDFYQSIGGDGPPIDSQDGMHAWKWQREGKKVFAPVKVYSASGAFQSIGTINSQFSDINYVEFPKKSAMGWVQTYIDRYESDKHLWILARDLNRATWNGTTMEAHSLSKGTNHVAALAQANQNPDKLYMLQDGNVFISADRGTTFGDAISTPFSKTSEAYARGDMGGGVVLPTNDNWILFCGPSTNTVGAILSKDGGQTWVDVTGDYPSGMDAQTSGLVATDDGKFVFAGTDVGPYVFDVANEKWFSIAEGIGFFNAMDVDYISATNTVRFGTWGSGIIDFTIEENSLSINETPDTLEKLSLYPNPASEVITLELKSLKYNNTLKVIVYTIQGKEVISTSKIAQNETDVQINVSGLASGMYVAKVFTENNTLQGSAKFMVK